MLEGPPRTLSDLILPAGRLLSMPRDHRFLRVAVRSSHLAALARQLVLRIRSSGMDSPACDQGAGSTRRSREDSPVPWPVCGSSPCLPDRLGLIDCEELLLFSAQLRVDGEHGPAGLGRAAAGWLIPRLDRRPRFRLSWLVVPKANAPDSPSQDASSPSSSCSNGYRSHGKPGIGGPSRHCRRTFYHNAIPLRLRHLWHECVAQKPFKPWALRLSVRPQKILSSSGLHLPPAIQPDGTEVCRT